jgi:fumarate reductase flavoprotein subunit
MVPAAGTRWQRAAGVDDSPSLFAGDIMRKTNGRAAGAPRRASRATGRTATWPFFWLALLLVLVIALELRLLPPTGSIQIDGLQALILPVVAIWP